MSENLQLEWGLQPPKSAVAAWGARAILEGSRFDLLWDRQDCKAHDDADKGRLGAILNGGVLDKAREVIAQRHAQGRVNPRRECLHLLVQDRADDDHLIFVEADTRGSCGYLYLVAYLTKCQRRPS